MFTRSHFDKSLMLGPVLGILLFANMATSQESSTPLLRFQRSKAHLDLETNVAHGQGLNGVTFGKNSDVFRYPNSLSCLVVYSDGKYVLEKREEATLGKPKIKTAEGALTGDDLQHLKAILNDDTLRNITTPKMPDFPDNAVAVREIESIDAQIDHAGTEQHFTIIKERLKTSASSGMDAAIDNGAPYQKTLSPLMKWFEGLEKKSKSRLEGCQASVLCANEHRLADDETHPILFHPAWIGADVDFHLRTSSECSQIAVVSFGTPAGFFVHRPVLHVGLC